MPTRSELRDLVRSQTLVESDDYTDDKVNNLINQALRDVSVRFDWPYLAKIDTIAVTGAQDTYALPSDTSRVEAVLLEGQAQPLNEVAPSVALREDGTTPGSGTPTWYFLWGNNVVLRPVPSASGTLTIYYYRTPTTLTNDGSSPEFAEQFHYIVADFVMQQLWEREEDFEKAAVYAGRYAAGVESMARFYLNRVNDGPMIVGEPNRARRIKGPRMTWMEV